MLMLNRKNSESQGWPSGLGLKLRCSLLLTAVGGAVEINPKCAQTGLGHPASPQKTVAMVHVVLFPFFSQKRFCSLNIRNMDGPVH